MDEESNMQVGQNTVKCLSMPQRYALSLSGKITRTEGGEYVPYDEYSMLYRLYKMNNEQRDALLGAIDVAGPWLSAALDDPLVCEEAKEAFRELLRLSEPPEWYKIFKSRQKSSKEIAK